MNIREILENAKKIAVVGCSTNPTKDAHNVPAFLQKMGYTIIPVNPNCDRVLGQTCYADLKGIPEDMNIDIIDIFRRPKDTEKVVDDAIDRFGKSKHKPVIWTQFGVSSDLAKRQAEEAGFEYVENRCLKVEYQKNF
ncbi:MAG TPA: CoA-binding protein [Balneolales bacterium]|nr:CoA-binding protein [Balneolales bacterium]